MLHGLYVLLQKITCKNSEGVLAWERNAEPVFVFSDKNLAEGA